MKEGDRATKEQEEKKRLMDEALAVAASAKKAQQERAIKEEAEKAEKKRLLDEAAATLASSLNEKATIISDDKPPVVPNDATSDSIQTIEGTETVTTSEGDATTQSEPAAWVSVQCRLVNAGAAGLKVAADVGANLAAATAEVTRTSLQKVSEVTKITVAAFASADSIRYTKLYDGFTKQDKAIETTINAGTITQIPFFVPKGRAIIWKMLVKSLDINFSIKLRVMGDGGATEHDLEVERKVSAGEYFVGERKAMDEERHIVLFFDNKLSKLRNKTLVYKVTIASPEAVAEVREQYTREAEEFAAQALAAKAETPPPPPSADSSSSGEQRAGEDDSAPASVPKTNAGLVGNLLGALSTAQANAGILAQRAGENPRVSGALSFIQNQSTGVLGKLGWGGKKGEKEGGGAEGGVGVGEVSVASSSVDPPSSGGGVVSGAGGGGTIVSVATTTAAAASSSSGLGDDSFQDDSIAPASFVTVNLSNNNATATATTTTTTNNTTTTATPTTT